MPSRKNRGVSESMTSLRIVLYTEGNNLPERTTPANNALQMLSTCWMQRFAPTICVLSVGATIDQLCYNVPMLYQHTITCYEVLAACNMHDPLRTWQCTSCTSSKQAWPHLQWHCSSMLNVIDLGSRFQYHLQICDSNSKEILFHCNSISG